MYWIYTLCAVTPLLAILCWKDCKFRLLPNSLTLGLAALGLVWRLVFGGISGFVDGLLGGLLCAAFLLIPFLMRGAGGGDLKMIFAAGIFFGLRFSCAGLLFISICGLVLGLVMMAFGAVSSGRLKHNLRSIFDWRYDRKAGAEKLPPREDEKGRVPFGVAIAIGTILTLFYAWALEVQP